MSTKAEADGDSRANADSAWRAVGQQPALSKLRGAAHYPTWRTDAQVALERLGAEGIHTQAMDSGEWSECVKKVEQVKEAARLAALSLVLGRAPTSSSLPASSSSASRLGKGNAAKAKSELATGKMHGWLLQIC